MSAMGAELSKASGSASNRQLALRAVLERHEAEEGTWARTWVHAILLSNLLFLQQIF